MCIRDRVCLVRTVLKWFLAAWVLFMVTLFALSCEDNNTDFIDEMLVEEVELMPGDIVSKSSFTSKNTPAFNQVLLATNTRIYVFFPADEKKYNFNPSTQATGTVKDTYINLLINGEESEGWKIQRQYLDQNNLGSFGSYHWTEFKKVGHNVSYGDEVDFEVFTIDEDNIDAAITYKDNTVKVNVYYDIDVNTHIDKEDILTHATIKFPQPYDATKESGADGRYSGTYEHSSSWVVDNIDDADFLFWVAHPSKTISVGIDPRVLNIDAPTRNDINFNITGSYEYDINFDYLSDTGDFNYRVVGEPFFVPFSWHRGKGSKISTKGSKSTNYTGNFDHEWKLLIKDRNGDEFTQYEINLN